MGLFGRFILMEPYIMKIQMESVLGKLKIDKEIVYNYDGIWKTQIIKMNLTSGKEYPFELYHFATNPQPILKWRFNNQTNFTDIPLEAFSPPQINNTIPQQVMNASLNATTLELVNTSLFILGNLFTETLQINSSQLIVGGNLTVNTLYIVLSTPFTINISQCFIAHQIILESYTVSQRYNLLYYNCETLPEISVELKEYDPCMVISQYYLPNNLDVVIHNKCTDNNDRFDTLDLIIVLVSVGLGLALLIGVIYVVKRRSTLSGQVKHLRKLTNSRANVDFELKIVRESTHEY